MQDIFIAFILVFLLFVIIVLVVALFNLFQQLRKSQGKVESVVTQYENQLRDIQVKQQREIEKARQQSVDSSRRTIKGQIAEQLAPLLAGFPFLPSDSHFIGDPVDYIVFDGYTDFKDRHVSGDKIELVIVDIKHSKAQLSDGQKQIAKAIEAGRVRFETVRISDDGTIKTHSWNSSKKVSSTPAEAKPIEMPSGEQVMPANTEIQPPENPNSAPNNNWYEFLKTYPNSYEPWSESDDDLLKGKYLAGMKIKELSLLLKRNPGRIRSRLKEKGLIRKK